jgi:hypothetical protein
MKEELWLPVVGFKNYEVSNLGRVASLKYAKQTGVRATLSASFKTGYLRIEIRGKGRFIHHLVARAFIGPRPKGLVINHKNGKKTDNRPKNLEYVTPSQNSKHNFVIELQCNKGENHSQHKLTDTAVLDIRSMRKQGATLKTIGAKHGIGKALVSMVANKKRWTHIPDEKEAIL